MTWTPALVEQVKGLWLKHHSGTEIAVALSKEHDMKLTKNSIICKMHRLGMSGKGGTRQSICRPPPVRRKDMTPSALEALRERERITRAQRRGANPVPAARRERPAPAPRPAPAVPARPAPVAPPRPVGILPSLDIPLTALREGMCRFIAVDPLDVVPAPCCGHPTAEGSSWYEGHRRICTVPTRPAAFIPRRAA
ncbi:GcrA family cell cycle regulator [Methylobacterium sp. Leaf117]|uniref:GcrA family cell cycle regulator n=1 Tax=Methylobacterium sp. Leaf117 TaxID=1736260 RepID=UPI0006F7AB98|nr:GcrA family cell cycle regulator [Methylobacterium sp. Leaf117]KQP92958.1 hypothetical protein ASF57_22640 [Methylobacterium sp. Leaf117]